MEFTVSGFTIFITPELLVNKFKNVLTTYTIEITNEPLYNPPMTLNAICAYISCRFKNLEWLTVSWMYPMSSRPLFHFQQSVYIVVIGLTCF